jgi:hypothetical protein
LGAAEPRYVLQSPGLVENCVRLYVPLLEFNHDPPVLRALLLAAGDDKEVRAQISRAYYGQMEGAQFSPFVLNGILLSAIYAALKDSSAINRNGNGSHPEHHAEHVATLTKHLEELKKAEETHARQAPDVKHYLEQMVARQEDILRRIRVLEHPGEQYKGFVGKLREAALTITVCAMVFAVGLGWMLCWWYLHR